MHNKNSPLFENVTVTTFNNQIATPITHTLNLNELAQSENIYFPYSGQNHASELMIAYFRSIKQHITMINIKVYNQYISLNNKPQPHYTHSQVSYFPDSVESVILTPGSPPVQMFVEKIDLRLIINKLDIDIKNQRNTKIIVAELELEVMDSSDLGIETYPLQHYYIVINLAHIISSQIPIIEIAIEPSVDAKTHRVNLLYSSNKTAPFDLETLEKQPLSEQSEISMAKYNDLKKSKASIDLVLSKEISLVDFKPSKYVKLLGNTYDRSNLSTNFACALFRQMGHLAPEHRYLFLYIKDNKLKDFYSIYTLQQNIEDALAANLKPFSAAADNSGFVFTLSSNDQNADVKTASGQNIIVNFPRNIKEIPNHKNALKALYEKFENALQTFSDWRQYMNESSLIDLLIIDDVLCNPGGFYSGNNTVFFINKYTNKLEASIMDTSEFFKDALAASINSHNDILLGAGLRLYNDADWNGNKIIKYLMSDALFFNNFKKRFLEIKNNILSVANIRNIVYAMIDKIQAYDNLEYQMWPSNQQVFPGGIFILAHISSRIQLLSDELYKINPWIYSSDTGIFSYPGDKEKSSTDEDESSDHTKY